METPTVVRSFQLRHEAEFAVATLESAGIKALVSGGDLGGADPVLGMALGIKVLVDAAQAEAADELLKSLAVPHDPTPMVRRSAPHPRGGLSRRLMQLSWAAAAVVIAASYTKEREAASTEMISYGIMIVFVAMLLTIWHFWRLRPRPGSYDRLDAE